MDISERIKARRKELGLSLDDVAKRLGVHRSTVKRYEDGIINVQTLPLINQFAQILLTTPEYLMGMTENDINGENSKKLNPQIKVIARAFEKMSDEQITQLRKMAEMLFPEAFK